MLLAMRDLAKARQQSDRSSLDAESLGRLDLGMHMSSTWNTRHTSVRSESL